MNSLWARFRRGYVAVAVIALNFAVLVVAANLLASLYLAVRGPEADPFGWYANPPPFIVKALEASFPQLGEEERRELWRTSEISHVPDPLVLFRETATASEYVHVDPNGFRVGRDQGVWPPSEETYNVFFFGGSTAFGYGVPDAETVPSHLQGLLPRVDGREVRLYNFARGGFNSTLETLLFHKLLLLSPAPDLAVFLDGVNDFAYPVDPAFIVRLYSGNAERSLATPVLPLLQELPLARLLGPGAWNVALTAFAERHQETRLIDVDDAELIERSIERYLANQAVITALGAAHDVGVVFVWQPAPTYKYDLRFHTYEQASFGIHERSRRGYPRMRARLDERPLGANFVWCADIQENARKLLYVDRMHYNPAMSRRLAHCIASALVERGLLD